MKINCLRMFLSFSIFMLPFILVLRLLLSCIHDFRVDAVSWQDSLRSLKWHHTSRQLSDAAVRKLVDSIDGHHADFNNTLDAILVPRAPGTETHSKVRKFIIDAMESLKWTVEEDKFTNSTPHGDKPFSNIVATLNPKGCKRFVLACHYESLHMREGTFVGATDSAVPCTMLIHMAKLMDDELKKYSEKHDDLTLQFIFFDGEEAFVQWNEADSLYGSRHLAKVWNTAPFPQENDAHCRKYGDFVSAIDRLDVFVLLDLLGSANPIFYSYFPDTYSLYMELANAEKRLNRLKLMELPPPQQTTNYFRDGSVFGYVQDDHIPFMNKGVPIVHIIPAPFPAVWHKESDNKQNLHHPTINNLNKIFSVFVAEYFHLYTPDPIAM